MTRILIKTPRGLRSIDITNGAGDSYPTTKTIPKGSTLIRHSRGKKVIAAYYEDDDGWWQTLLANTKETPDPLNEVYIYSGSNLGRKDLLLKF